MAKLTNKDKQLIRQALFHHVESLLFAISDENSGYYEDFKHLDNDDVANYCYKIIGLYPKTE